jgi:hypothetical protein
MQEQANKHSLVPAVSGPFREGLFAAIEQWRGRQPIIPSRPDAIRQLIQKSLADDGSAQVRKGADR